MDTRVDRTASATANAHGRARCRIQRSKPRSASGEERTSEQSFEVACTGPGQATFTFTTVISPDRSG